MNIEHDSERISLHDFNELEGNSLRGFLNSKLRGLLEGASESLATEGLTTGSVSDPHVKWRIVPACPKVLGTRLWKGMDRSALWLETILKGEIVEARRKPTMPREAQLFDSCSGSAVKGFLKLQGNIPPRWIDNARTSRKTIEPSIEKYLRKLQSLRKKRPRAKIAIKRVSTDLRDILDQWELRYRKEAFYRGIRTLLDIDRNGSSKL